MRRSRLSCLVIGFLLCGAPGLRADVAPRWSDDELVGFSELIVAGRVVSTATAYDPDVPYLYTYVTIDVDEVLKGYLDRSQVVLKQLGGTMNGITNYVAGQSTFEVGEDVLLFLEVRPRDGSLYTTALWQGKWTISTIQNTARRTVAGDGGVFSQAESGSVLSDFVSRIRAAAGDASRLPRRMAFTAVPPETPLASTPVEHVDRFTFLGPARWHQADTGTPVNVVVDASGEPAVPGGGFAEIAVARGLINGAASTLQLANGGTTGSRCRAQTGVSAIWVVFRDPCGEISDSGSTLAIGGGWFGSPFVTVNGQSFRGFSEGYVINNNSANTLNFFSRARCFQDVQTHEILHASGLGHSTDPNAIMFPTADNACFSAVTSSTADARITGALGTDDVNALQFIYPGGVPPPGSLPGAPPNFSCAANGFAVNCTWNASTVVSPPERAAATSYVFKARLTGGGPVIFAQNVGSQLVFGGAGPAGTFVLSVAGVNAAGEGPESLPQTVTLPGGGCTVAPNSPINVSNVVSGSTVTINWVDGGGCPATSYVLQATVGGVQVANTNVGNTLTFTAPGVPSGQYLATVSAQNANGTSAPSAPTVIDVP